MTDSPSALLERAAALIEQRAESATEGPWRHNPATHHHEPGTTRFSEAVFAGESDARAVCVATTGESDDRQSMHDAAWIAMLGPQAAQPLVEWLRRVRDIIAFWETAEYPEHVVRHQMVRHVEAHAAAFSFARTVLGESQNMH